MDLFKNLEIYSKNIAIIDEDKKEYTYKDLLYLSDKLTKNIKKRQIIFLICNNSYEFVAIYIGLIRKKCIVFLINNSINKKKFLYLVEHYKPNFIFFPKGNKTFDERSKKIFSINNKYFLYQTKFKKKQRTNKNLAVLMTTSGSTGSPKFVMLSYLNLFNNAKNISSFLNIKSSDRPITTMQPSYSYGLSIINSHLIKGASIIMTNASLIEKRFWNLLKQKKATTFGGVPYIYEILKKLNFDRMNLPYLNYITQAGGKLNNDLLSNFIKVSKKKKIKFYVMYGQTEATARMSYLKWDYTKSKLGSIGKPIPGGRFMIYDEKGKLIKKNNFQGELVYIGKNVMIGYADKIKDLLKKEIKNKKLFTGDIAKRDSDNFYYITGRKNRYIKIFGMRFNLDEIEYEIRKLNINCACLGSDDNLNVFTTNLKKEAIISKFLMQNLKINKSAFKLISVERIPRNKDGKVLYSKLKI